MPKRHKKSPKRGFKHKNKKKKNNKAKNDIKVEDILLKDLSITENERDEHGNKKHKWWNNNPVPQMGDKIKQDVSCQVEEIKKENISKEPLKLPAQFKWVDLDLTDDKTMQEFYDFLSNHYVGFEDYRFHYSKGCLKWALLVPGYHKFLHLGVRNVKNGALMACITVTPATTVIHQKELQTTEVNFLCIHPDLRSKRLVPVLVEEAKRRVYLNTKRWQSVYTAGSVLAKPLSYTTYWHRFLDPLKLIDIKFTAGNKRMTKLAFKKSYKLPAETKTVGLRRMEEKDCESAHQLLANYLKQFSFHQGFSLDEFKHYFLTREGVIYSYVVEDAQSKEVTDLISFFILPSSVANNAKYNDMKAAYSYYNVATSVKLEQIMNDALILAKNLGMDVFNALDIMDNPSFFKECKFKAGTGKLQYYFWNWKCKEMPPREIAVVLF